MQAQGGLCHLGCDREDDANLGKCSVCANNFHLACMDRQELASQQQDAASQDIGADGEGDHLFLEESGVGALITWVSLLRVEGCIAGRN